MSQKNNLLKGTFILTAAGIATRIMGFFFRIFLGRNFHAEEIGLYQLIFPFYSLILSFTSAGIQTALARLVAANIAKRRSQKAYAYLKAAIFCTLFFSVICLLLIQKYAFFLASSILKEPRCASLLSLMSYVLPFAAIHSCICGYFLGQKQIKFPALSQLLEQTARILFVMILSAIGACAAFTPPIAVAVLGLACGEIFATFLSICAIQSEKISFSGSDKEPFFPKIPSLLFAAFPLTASRILLNLFQSLEAFLLPPALQKYGMSVSASLSTYGILTGIALPCILFPSALTNSISTMLLPEVAGMPEAQRNLSLPLLLRRVLSFCLLLGFGCLFFFFAASGFISKQIFHTPEAKNYILTLSFICPFFYTNTALVSMLNGLDMAGKTFLINFLSLLIRIAGVLFLIPQVGILGYLWMILASQFLTFILCLFLLIRSFSAVRTK